MRLNKKIGEWDRIKLHSFITNYVSIFANLQQHQDKLNEVTKNNSIFITLEKTRVDRLKDILLLEIKVAHKSRKTMIDVFSKDNGYKLFLIGIRMYLFGKRSILHIVDYNRKEYDRDRRLFSPDQPFSLNQVIISI